MVNPAQIILLSSTFCVMLTLHFSVQLLSEHFICWKKPKEQKAIAVIVLMAPLYAIDSYVGLIDFQGSKAFFMFLDSIKECYEALVIAKFLALLYSYLNISISKNNVPDGIKGREIHHSFPMTLCFSSIGLGNLLSFAVCAILMITLRLVGVYPSWLSWTFTIVLNISVSLALYSLVIFYHVFDKELAPHKPLAKFLCIKGIVFFCFCQKINKQVCSDFTNFKDHINNEAEDRDGAETNLIKGIVLDVLVALKRIQSHHKWLDVEHIEEALQNMLVCVEMVVFSVIQKYVYSAIPYRDNDVSTVKQDQKKE